ncbi:restriction endonuclease [Bacillus sp. DX1.1]|uniref:restriction endonuclease n=1 Tax=unclassified Bacillus (in: firmicutes) TaxID=185979 RepID=UPI0025707FDE|nr:MULTISPECIES: restriction endonuclease [unclassified Bacillus (in: firmicutes)]MDM5153545.1 restriction endonuclease [Bacillus sp. DX1.1]WJE82497.1 restriction endonuclease [Bacillus sp. DX3.1]
MANRYHYQKTISNEYLRKSKLIKAASSWELNLKIQEQEQKWAQAEMKQRERDKIQDIKMQTEFDTIAAQEVISEYQNILNTTLEVDDTLDWKSQKKYDTYPTFVHDSFNTQKPSLDSFKQTYNVPAEGILEKFISPLKRKRIQLEEQAKEAYEKALKEYDEAYDTYEKQKEDALKEHLHQKETFELEQLQYNDSITNWQKQFELGESEAIEKYVNVVLENSLYPDGIEKEYDVQFRKDLNTLLVSYKLPNPASIPNIIEYKYIATRKEVKSVEMKKKEFEEFYESVVFQITLRTIHEIFEAVYNNDVDIVVFNGWISYIDEATGNDSTSCIISVQASREEFESIKLDRVDYKKCIQSLKGLFAGKLTTLAPVKPIMTLQTTDKRFVESKEVLANLTSADNLATMHWEDFEHLVRELFEKMFNEDGAEVKVTQASRDGGVDAIAFDPDPIKGGKFIIQAKRYNMTVPVSAVRDLYGTMLHEGATKGILVTTSSFGKDSVAFIKDKPITLIDGQNLLYLFNKFGYSTLNITLNR